MFVINLLRNILLGSSYMFWHPRIMIGLTLVAYNVCKSKMAAKMATVNVKNVCTYKFCLCLSSVYAESSSRAIKKLLVITESDVLHITVSVFFSGAGRFSPPVTALFHSMTSQNMVQDNWAVTHVHLAVAHGWSVAQPHLVSLRTSGGASATPSATVTGSSDFVASSFPRPSSRSGGSFSEAAFQIQTW